MARHGSAPGMVVAMMSDPWQARADGQPAPPSATSDEELLERIRGQDQEALALLYDRYGGLLFTLALRIVGDRDLAAEVTQDAFLRCWRGVAAYEPGRGRVAAWLMGITRNRAIDELRSGQHQARLRERAPLPEGEGAGAGDPRGADPADLVVLRQTVTAALQSLSPAQRQAIELAYYGGLTQAEIARTLGEPLGTVKTRIRAAMERIRTILQPSLPAEGG